mmetsp:Transcript_41609/g.93901  ORF Transcript_41609/g.93901 Transcript_41609/m.93901 type:complete len:259 (-) Transcript_41609:7-783(-)
MCAQQTISSCARLLRKYKRNKSPSDHPPSVAGVALVHVQLLGVLAPGRHEVRLVLGPPVALLPHSLRLCEALADLALAVLRVVEWGGALVRGLAHTPGGLANRPILLRLRLARHRPVLHRTVDVHGMVVDQDLPDALLLGAVAIELPDRPPKREDPVDVRDPADEDEPDYGQHYNREHDHHALLGCPALVEPIAICHDLRNAPANPMWTFTISDRGDVPPRRTPEVAGCKVGSSGEAQQPLPPPTLAALGLRSEPETA